MHEDIIILNSKERKEIRKQLSEQFGILELPDKIFFCLNKKERVYITNRECFDVSHHALRVNAFGCYFGTFMVDGFRLSLDGIQEIGKLATKNIVQINKMDRDAWIKGEELVSEEVITKTQDFVGNYIILKFEEDFLGIGKVKEGRVMNYLPKSRKLKKVFDKDNLEE